MHLLPKHIIKPGLACIVLLLILSFLGCRRASSGHTSLPTISEKAIEPVIFGFDKIIERGVLKAVLDNSSTGYFIYKGQPMGYEYDLLSRLAKDLEVKLEISLTVDMDAAFEMLNNGQADLIAYHLTITKERSKRVTFTEPHTEVKQVLVQRLPPHWRSLKQHEIDKKLIRNPLDLVGKEVHVRKGSAFSSRLQHLSDEIGGDILIIEDAGKTDTETMIKKVADGEIDYTVADEDVGLINAAYYRNIDVATPISFPQKIAWAVRKNAPVLKDTINHWVRGIKSKPDFNVIYNRYFKYTKSQYVRANSDFSSVGGDKISPYDAILKGASKTLSMDWMLLASLVYQESKFNPSAESWAGAKGLMQLTDQSIKQYKVKEPFNVEENLKAGVKHLKWLEKLWKDKIKDPKERIKFVLASYNVGQGHVLDAVKLARKYGKDPAIWESHVAYYLLQKSKSQYYKDPVVDFGYCRGQEPVNYVAEILDRYRQYKLLFNKDHVGVDSTVVASTRSSSDEL